MNHFYFKISPESISKEIIDQVYQNNDFGYYSPMEYVLRNGLLGNIELQINLDQKIDDIGFYTAFDGEIETLNKLLSFTISGNPFNNFEILFIDNTINNKKFNKDSEYTIDWGDNFIEEFNPSDQNFITHQYSQTPSSYTIKYTQKSKWGVNEIKQTLSVPYVSNLSLSADMELMYDDVENLVTGFTNSRLSELKRYGSIKFIPLSPIYKDGEIYGNITEMNNQYTAYTINNIDYYDYPNGQTIYVVTTNGLYDQVVYSGAVKEEVLLGVVDSPEIQSEIFIDRGKLSGLENLQRLGEVDNLGDLQNYGYKYFKINTE